jgi:mono/diheme cytochrome c family protein
MERQAARAFFSTVLIATLVWPGPGCRSEGIIGKRDPSDPPVASGGPPPGGASGATGAGGMAPAMPPPWLTGMMPAANPAPGLVATMPPEVQSLLQARCAGCHRYGQADPAGWGAALDMSRLANADVVVPGDPDASRMIDRVAVVGNMPPSGPRLTADEVALLRKWIAGMPRAGAGPLSDEDVLDRVAADQLGVRDRNADYRYVSFANFVGQERSQVEMEAAQRAFTFVLNSLSRRGQIVEPVPIDMQATIFRVRLSDLGWDARVWDTITAFYPYCLRSDATSHQALYVQLGTEAPVVRGDWFLATVTRSPLYEFLIAQPASLDQLAATLGVNIDDDINHLGRVEPDNLVRVGFRRSGVALHNRMIERHLGQQGQYLWISYDFDSDIGRADVLANPLGPRLRDQQRFVHTFENTGGEVIYTLPNGLQGYMVVNAAGARLDAVPLTIARDPNRRDSVVRNGLSCFGCHGSPGLLRPRQTDETPIYSDTHIAEFEGRELDEIDASYPRTLRPDILAQDGQRYRASAESVPGGGPPRGDSEYATFTALVGQYESNLGFHGAAFEFHEEYDSFRARVLANDFQNQSLPRSTAAPLISRDDFVCLFRDLVTKIRRNAVFCARTFDADAVRNLCSGGRRTSGSSGSSSGGGGAGPGRSPDAGMSTRASEPDAGAPADAGRQGRCQWVRVDGRSVCR